MKNKNFKLSVPQPCHEDWNNMTPEDKGRFCANCEKVVVDFTHKTDREIAKFVKNKKTEICGRFNTTQLNRDLTEYQPIKNYFVEKAATLAIAGSLTALNLEAQIDTRIIGKMVKIEQVDNPEKTECTGEAGKEVTIKGTVVDENDEVMIGANIFIPRYNIGTASDIDGEFELKIPSLKENTVEIHTSYVGYEDFITVVRAEHQTIKLEIKHEEEVFIGLMVVKKPSIIQRLKSYFTPRTTMGEIAIVPPKVPSELPLESEEINSIPPHEILPIPENFSDINIINLYPNPFNQAFNIELDAKQKKKVLINILDTKGKLIHSESQQLTTGKNLLNINLDNKKIIDGIYILQVTDKEGNITAKKLIKVSEGGIERA